MAPKPNDPVLNDLLMEANDLVFPTDAPPSVRTTKEKFPTWMSNGRGWGDRFQVVAWIGKKQICLGRFEDAESCRLYTDACLFWFEDHRRPAVPTAESPYSTSREYAKELVEAMGGLNSLLFRIESHLVESGQIPHREAAKAQTWTKQKTGRTPAKETLIHVQHVREQQDELYTQIKQLFESLAADRLTGGRTASEVSRLLQTQTELVERLQYGAKREVSKLCADLANQIKNLPCENGLLRLEAVLAAFSGKLPV